MLRVLLVALLVNAACSLQLGLRDYSSDMARTSSRRGVLGTAAAAAAFGLALPSAHADDEYISPAKAKILAAKAAAEAKTAANAPSAGTVSAKPKQAVALPTEGRKGKAQSAQAAQKKLAKQLEREKQALAAQRAAEREIAKANEKPLELPSLPSLPSISLPF